MVDWLRGKKTYILVVLVALHQLVEFVTAGSFTISDWMDFLNAEAITAMFATIRAGIGKIGNT